MYAKRTHLQTLTARDAGVVCFYPILNRTVELKRIRIIKVIYLKYYGSVHNPTEVNRKNCLNF